MAFLFRGDRRYLQGADFFIYVENFLKKKKFKSLNLICKNFINTEPRIKYALYSRKKSIKEINYSVLCIIENQKNKIYIKFNNSKKKIKNSYSYDDKLFYDYFRINKNNTATCNFFTSFKDIEILIALTKFWHERKIKKKGKWVFTRLKLIKKFNNKTKKNFKIKNIYNKFNKYTVSNVIQNNKLIGEIHFLLM